MKTLARPGDRAELLHRLRALRPESARRWGRMSVHQMVCHLGDAFRMVMGRKPADWLRWGYLHMDHHLRQFGA